MGVYYRLLDEADKRAVYLGKWGYTLVRVTQESSVGLVLTGRAWIERMAADEISFRDPDPDIRKRVREWLTERLDEPIKLASDAETADEYYQPEETPGWTLLDGYTGRMR